MKITSSARVLSTPQCWLIRNNVEKSRHVELKHYYTARRPSRIQIFEFSKFKTNNVFEWHVARRRQFCKILTSDAERIKTVKPIIKNNRFKSKFPLGI